MDSSDQRALSFDKATFYVLLALTFLLPVFFIPTSAAPFQFSKTLLALIAVFVAFVLFIKRRTKEGGLSIPVRLSFWAVWALPVAYVLSALFTGSRAVSLFGLRMEPDTVSFIALAAVLFSLIVFSVETLRQHFMLYGAVALSALLLALFEALHLLTGGAITSLGIFTDPIANPMGKWNDLAILFGGVALLSLLLLSGFSRRSGMFSLALYAMLTIALAMLAVVNFSLVWIVLAVAAFGVFVYSLYRYYLGAVAASQQSEGVGIASGSGLFASVLVLIVCGVFLFSPLGASISNSLDVAQVEARPSWQSTLSILSASYGSNAIFGSGPNTFTEQWSSHKPQEVNTTPFWAVDFASSVGYIPTSLVTTGLVGALAWLLFLGVLLLAGVRTLMVQRSEDDMAYLMSFTSFMLAAYYWVLATIYVPSGVNVLLAFIFSGLFVASLRHHEGVPFDRPISFVAMPRLGFSIVFLSVLIVLAGAASLYVAGERYVAAASLQRGLIAANVDGNLAAARTHVARAATLVPAGQYHRAAAEASFVRLNQIVAENQEPTDAIRAEFQNVLSQAVSSAIAARDYNPREYQNWLMLGRVYAAVAPLGIEGAYESARNAFMRARERNPHNPGILLELARLEAARGEADEARSFIQQAIAEKGNYTEAVFFLTQLEISEGNIESAINSAEASAVLSPNDPTVYFQLGVLYYQDEDYASAAQALERAVALNNDYSNARYFLGLAYYELDQVEEAIGQFERVADLNPDNEEVPAIIENLEAGEPPLPESEQAAPEKRDTLPISE